MKLFALTALLFASASLARNIPRIHEDLDHSSDRTIDIDQQSTAAAAPTPDVLFPRGSSYTWDKIDEETKAIYQKLKASRSTTKLSEGSWGVLVRDVQVLGLAVFNKIEGLPSSGQKSPLEASNAAEVRKLTGQYRKLYDELGDLISAALNLRQSSVTYNEFESFRKNQYNDILDWLDDQLALSKQRPSRTQQRRSAETSIDTRSSTIDTPTNVPSSRPSTWPGVLLKMSTVVNNIKNVPSNEELNDYTIGLLINDLNNLEAVFWNKLYPATPKSQDLTAGDEPDVKDQWKEIHITLQTLLKTTEAITQPVTKAHYASCWKVYHSIIDELSDKSESHSSNSERR